MHHHKSVLFTLIVFVATLSGLNAATIPSGTNIGVLTVDSMSSHEKIGRTFRAKLEHSVGGLPAGTLFVGTVESSRAGTRSGPLTLQLTSVVVNGRKHKVKTADYEPQVRSRHARARAHGITSGEAIFTPGTRMTFVLREPLSL